MVKTAIMKVSCEYDRQNTSIRFIQTIIFETFPHLIKAEKTQTKPSARHKKGQAPVKERGVNHEQGHNAIMPFTLFA